MSTTPKVPDYLADVPTSGEIPQSLLNIDNKERSNLFAWSGQFSPQLVEVLMREYSTARSVILDPFAGSGTVLYEAGRVGRSAIAAEINPSACCLARAYEFVNIKGSARIGHIEAVEQIVSPIRDLELTDATACHEALVESWLATHSAPQKMLLEALIVLVDFQRLGAGQQRIASTWRKLRSVVETLPHSEARLEVFNCDARRLPIRDGCTELVITSPPYINVFNYHQQYRASAEGLGWNLLTVAKSEIGSNRKHRANRFLTVIQYCLDITSVLCELSRVCKHSARVIFVVGRESRVRGIPFFNGELVARLATGCTDLRFSLRQERVFKNRFGENIVEDILHLTRRKSTKTSDLFGLSDARAIAKSVLEKAMEKAEGEVAADILEAIASVPKVEPSPMYVSQDARNKHGETNDFPHATLR
jgi:16S rRNA G966 N2-methylase RsmD